MALEPSTRKVWASWPKRESPPSKTNARALSATTIINWRIRPNRHAKTTVIALFLTVAQGRTSRMSSRRKPPSATPISRLITVPALLRANHLRILTTLQAKKREPRAPPWTSIFDAISSINPKAELLIFLEMNSPTLNNSWDTLSTSTTSTTRPRPTPPPSPLHILTVAPLTAISLTSQQSIIAPYSKLKSLRALSLPATSTIYPTWPIAPSRSSRSLRVCSSREVCLDVRAGAELVPR